MKQDVRATTAPRFHKNYTPDLGFDPNQNDNSLKALNPSPKKAQQRAARFDDSEPLTGGDGKMHRLLEYNTYRQSILVQL